MILQITHLPLVGNFIAIALEVNLTAYKLMLLVLQPSECCIMPLLPLAYILDDYAAVNCCSKMLHSRYIVKWSHAHFLVKI